MQETTSSLGLHTVRDTHMGCPWLWMLPKNRVINICIYMIQMALRRYQEVWQGVWTRLAVKVSFGINELGGISNVCKLVRRDVISSGVIRRSFAGRRMAPET